MILVSGINKDCQLLALPNNKNKFGHPIVSPPSRVPIDPQTLISLSLGKHHAAFVTKSGTAYGFGDDRNFLIGTKKAEIYNSPIEVHFPENFSRDILLYNLVACGKNYTIYSTVYGIIFYCHKKCQNRQPAIFKITKPKIVKLVGGSQFPIAIDSCGDLIIFSKDLPTKQPLKVRLNSPVIDVCCGVNFCCAVLDNGEVYGSGTLFNKKNNKNSPSSVSSLLNDSASTTTATTSATTTKIPASGAATGTTGGSGECGDSVEHVVFEKIDNLSRIVQISGFESHIIALDDNGNVFSCGAGNQGQLGQLTKADSPEFHQIAPSTFKNEKITQIAAGKCHSLFLSERYHLFGCGRNVSGELLINHFGGIEQKVLQTNLENVTYIWAAYNSAALIGTRINKGYVNQIVFIHNPVQQDNPASPKRSGALTSIFDNDNGAFDVDDDFMLRKNKGKQKATNNVTPRSVNANNNNNNNNNNAPTGSVVKARPRNRIAERSKTPPKTNRIVGLHHGERNQGGAAAAKAADNNNADQQMLFQYNLNLRRKRVKHNRSSMQIDVPQMTKRDNLIRKSSSQANQLNVPDL